MSRITALIVERGPERRRLLEHAASARGYDYMVIDQHTEVLIAVEHKRIDVIVVGCELEGMTPAELIPAIRMVPAARHPYVLAILDADRPDAMSAVLAAGANDYLHTPIDAALLEVRLDAAERVRRYDAPTGPILRPPTETIPDDSQSQARNDLRELIENMPDFVLLYRGERIVFMNSTGIEFFGASGPDDLIGRSMFDFIHPDDRATARQRIAATQKSGRRIPQRELRLVRIGGDVVSAEVVGGRPIVFDGKPTSLIVIRDITQRKKIQSRLMQVDRMVSVGTLAAGIAHEINNPLSYVIGNLAYLSEMLHRMKGELDPDRLADLSESMSEAREGAERVRNIVADLRTLSRADDSEPVPIDVNEVLESTLNVAGNDVRYWATIERQFSDVNLINANRARLSQVFLNLLMNALQAFPERDPTNNRVRITTRNEHGQVLIEITDNGSGIPAEVREKMFEPFFTTKPIGVGTGIGLSICDSVVRSLGGEILVESEVGKGSSFRIEIPALSAEESGTLPIVGPESTGAARVLVIDDEVIVARSVRRALTHYEVALAGGGEEALELCRKGDFDVVFCDILMPDMSGLDFYRHIRKARPGFEQRIVFMTGGQCTSEVRDFVAEVGNEIIEKPFDIQQMRAIVRRYATRAN